MDDFTKAHNQRSLSLLDRAYRRLLAVYPKEFRAEYGTAMAQVFRDRCREEQCRRGVLGVIGVWLHTLADVAATAPAQHLDRLAQDLRQAARTFRRSPAFTAVIVLTLALGIGANTAMFSVIHAVLLRPIPYRDPDRLVWITEVLPRLRLDAVPSGDFLDWRRDNRTLEQVAVYSAGSATLSGQGEPERVRWGSVSAEFLELLGVQPALGRGFLPGEDRAGAERVFVASYGFWQERFGGDSGALGKTLVLDGQPATLIGVLPAAFQFFDPAQIWTALPLEDPRQVAGQRMMLLRAIGRVRTGFTMAQARADLETITHRVELAYQWRPRGAQVRVVPLQEQLVTKAKPALLVLMGAVSLVLLVACANVANLLLARAVTRQQEMSIRTALGAGRRRLIRQLLTESVLLALVGGGLGLLLARWGIDALSALIPPGALGAGHALVHLRPDTRVLSFTVVVSLAIGILFGLAPALAASRPPSASRGAPTRTGGALGHFFVASEVGLTVVLLIGTGLLVKTLWRLHQIDPGFRAEKVLTMEISLNSAQYPDAARRSAFYRQSLEKIRGLPGVEVAGLTTELPLSGAPGSRALISAEGEPPWPSEDGERHLIQQPAASADYFRTMGIPLRRGRYFTEQDAEETHAIIANESLGRRFFPGDAPVGKHIKFGVVEAPLPWFTIVGLVGDVRQSGLDTEPRPTLYRPYVHARFDSSMYLVVRSSGDPATLAAAIRSRIWELDPRQPVYGVMPMEQRLAAWAAPQRFRTLLLGLFAAVALALAAVGIYGMLSYAVRQRTAEIGVRIALGAQSRDVLKLVVGQGMAVIAAGVGCGLVAALALMRLMADLLYEVTPRDPATFGAVSLFVAAVGLVASYLPARRAVSIDPMEALRHE